MERWRARLIERELSDPRHQAVANHTQGLAECDPNDLLALVKPDVGAWPVPELATTEHDIPIAVAAFRGFVPGTDDVLFHLSHRGRFGRCFCENFAIREGAISPLSDDEWGMVG